LARLVDDNSKVIRTSRTEYFRWAEESEKILAGMEFGRRILVLDPPKFEVVYIELLTDPQIKEIIVRRYGSEGAEIADRILKNRNLAQMARRPVLIELLLAALQDVRANLLESPAQVSEVNSNRFSFSSAMPQCRRPNDTSDADKTSERRSMIDSESRSQTTCPLRQTAHSLDDNVFYRV
jgi:hypothetical protein